MGGITAALPAFTTLAWNRRRSLIAVFDLLSSTSQSILTLSSFLYLLLMEAIIEPLTCLNRTNILRNEGSLDILYASFSILYKFIALLCERAFAHGLTLREESQVELLGRRLTDLARVQACPNSNTLSIEKYRASSYIGPRTEKS